MMNIPFLGSLLSSLSEPFLKDTSGRGALLLALMVVCGLFLIVHQGDTDNTSRHAEKIENLLTELIVAEKIRTIKDDHLESLLTQSLGKRRHR